MTAGSCCLGGRSKASPARSAGALIGVNPRQTRAMFDRRSHRAIANAATTATAAAANVFRACCARRLISCLQDLDQVEPVDTAADDEAGGGCGGDHHQARQRVSRAVDNEGRAIDVAGEARGRTQETARGQIDVDVAQRGVTPPLPNLGKPKCRDTVKQPRLSGCRACTTPAISNRLYLPVDATRRTSAAFQCRSCPPSPSTRP